MPFSSKAQQRYLEAHPEKLKGKIGEWEQATDFSKLPEKRGLSKRAGERYKRAADVQAQG